MEASECEVCGGARWVCEDHPDKPWDGASDREGCLPLRRRRNSVLGVQSDHRRGAARNAAGIPDYDRHRWPEALNHR
jgi:hypothetical protein